MLSNMLDTDSLIFAFKEKGALSTALLLWKFYHLERADVCTRSEVSGISRL